MLPAEIQFKYVRRYKKNTTREKIKRISHNAKAWLVKSLAKSKWLKLDPFDVISLNERAHDKYLLSHAFIDTPDVTPFLYQSLELSEVHFIEAIEIDNFESYK